MSIFHHPRYPILYWIILLATVIAFPGCKEAPPTPSILATVPETGGPTGAFGWVGIQFSEPVLMESVIAAFHLSPALPGEFLEEGNSLWFRPKAALDPTISYTATLQGEIQTGQGQSIAVDESWAFQVRQPAILYYQPTGDLGELMRLDPGKTEPQPITDTGGQVVDFAVSPTGEQIAYTVQNMTRGKDLWVVNRDGFKPVLLVNCGPDGCGEPAWSVNETIIAYTREVYHEETGGYDPAEIWTVLLATGETSQLYQSEFAYGTSPSFSPDGKKLASYDTTHNGIRILDLETSQESVIPRGLIGSGDWSPDGQQLIFTDSAPAENEPFVEIYVADLKTQAVQLVFGEAINDTDFSQPRWSPDGNWLAVSLRPVNAGVSKALWALSLDGSEKILIADEPSASFAAYRWDPWGAQLVYQRLSSSLTSSIWVWDWESGESYLLAENAARPQWLP